MYYIEEEMKSQFDSIDKTVNYILGKQKEIACFFEGQKKVWFVGSGSSYCLAQSASMIFNLNNPLYCANYVAAGDMMLNFEKYKNVMAGSVVVFLSRSGSTSELLRCLVLLKEIDCKCMAICARKNAETSKTCGLNLEIEWAFDHSVCQTRTVSNLYVACLALSACLANNDELISDLCAINKLSKAYRERYESELAKIGENKTWDNGVTLADCECAGLIAEGALAFKEICQNPSNFYNVLDVRHGPIVMIGETTLVFLLAAGMDKEYRDLVADIKQKGAICVTAGMFEEELGGDLHLQLPVFRELSVAAVFLLFSIQYVTLIKAFSNGVNPDKPAGLKPWIEL